MGAGAGVGAAGAASATARAMVVATEEPESVTVAGLKVQVMVEEVQEKVTGPLKPLVGVRESDMLPAVPPVTVSEVDAAENAKLGAPAAGAATAMEPKRPFC